MQQRHQRTPKPLALLTGDVLDVDYTSFGPKGSGGAPKDKTRAGANRRWWLLDGEEQANAITGNLDFLFKRQTGRLHQLVMSARLYGNLSTLGVNGLTLGSVAQTYPAIKDRISYNLIQSCVDAITAKISKNKPKPLFLTSGGEYKLQRRAKKLNQFVEGIFYENDAYRLGPQIFRDACVAGDGICHVFNRNGRVAWERVLCSELWADETEGFYGEPRSLHRVKSIDRDVLMDAAESWGAGARARAAIEIADGPTYAETGKSENLADLVMVRESWHLPSGPEAKDGRRVISIAGSDIISTKWKHDFFPFARLPWSRRLHGFWSQGLAEQLQNIQLEINRLLVVIQKSMHLAGSFKVFIHNTSKIVKEHINNDIGAIVSWAGQVEPKYVTPPIVPAEIYQHLSTLISRGFEQSGISALSAASQKPAGLNSGKALREYNDIESDRFMVVGQGYENFFLDCARLSIACVKDILEEGGGYSVKVPGRKFIDSVKWSEVNLEEDQYVMRAFPVSSLPNEPSGRFETVQEWAQAGLIEQDEVRPLMNLPDLDQSDNLNGAERELLNKILEQIVDDGEYTQPQPFDNLDLAFKLASQYYAQGRLQDLDEERLEMLRRFMKQVQALQQASLPPPQPQEPAGAPQGVPAAPPVSQLLPTNPSNGLQS